LLQSLFAAGGPVRWGLGRAGGSHRDAAVAANSPRSSCRTCGGADRKPRGRHPPVACHASGGHARRRTGTRDFRMPGLGARRGPLLTVSFATEIFDRCGVATLDTGPRHRVLLTPMSKPNATTAMLLPPPRRTHAGASAAGITAITTAPGITRPVRPVVVVPQRDPRPRAWIRPGATRTATPSGP